MAKQPLMINRVIELLGDGKTSKEITDDTGCSKATVSIARKRLKERENDINEATEDINSDVDDNVDGFIKRIKITPDQTVMNDTKEIKEDIEYGCPCSARWSAPADEKQSECPECGQEFE